MSRNLKARMNISTLTKNAGLALAIAALLGGCSKPPPPPPPPPPPAPAPPPPPPEVSLDTIIQDAKVDPRVQCSSGMQITEDRVGLAKAVAHLADAIARGDEKAMNALLLPGAQSVLSTLVSSGEWADSTKKIDAVRVVLIASGVNLSGMSAAADVSGELEKHLAGIPDSQKLAVKQMLGSMQPDAIKKMLAENWSTVENAMKAAGASDNDLDAIKQHTEEAVQAMTAAASPSGGDQIGVLLAIQDPQGAYLLGWAAERQGEDWKFGNAPSMPEIRARASSFDGIGSEGFQEVQLVSAPIVAPPADGGESTGGGGSSGGGGGGGGGGGSPSSPPASSPGKKSTPAGPVNIPGRH